MAKGQKRSSREAKKPKASKKTILAPDQGRFAVPAKPAPVKGGAK